MTGGSDQRASSDAATFFDVDGTLVNSTIAHYYAYFKRDRLPPVVSELWYAAFIVKCGYYLLLDKINRSMMNVVFYRAYRGLPAEETRAKSIECHDRVIRPRMYAQALPCVQEHRQAGRKIILVTGSIDFIIDPLAREIGADHVLASSLVELNGRFTGALDGPPIGEEEKARRIRQYAAESGIDLAASYGYGDSIADLPMLESVGFPAVVNPDKVLAAKARQRGWPIHLWTVEASIAGRGR